MREIVLDTETTGLNPLQGDRLVEIGCVELENHMTTGAVYHRYFNPDRDVPAEATRVHGLTNEFLADKPLFAQDVDSFLSFIGDAKLVIHNAAFDMGFLNMELARHGFGQLPADRAIDTLKIARERFPGSPASLDALCKRFGIDASARTVHGALLDAQLLADVYLELCGGRQPGLDMGGAEKLVIEETLVQKRTFRTPRPFPPSSEELAAHTAFLEKIKNPLWRKEDGHE